MIKRTVIIGSILCLTACGTKDLAYFQANVDEAKLKVESCKQAMKDALKGMDTQAYEEVKNDQECLHADEAYREHKKQLAKIEEEAKEEAYKEALAQERERLKEIPYPEFYALAKDCKKGFGLSASTFLSRGKKNPTCEVYSELRADRLLGEINLILEKYQAQALVEYKNKRCKGVEYSESACDVAERAIRKELEDGIAQYLDNREKLKTDFNQCQSRYQGFRKQKKYDDARAVKNEAKCKIVAEAAEKLKVYDFSQPIG